MGLKCPDCAGEVSNIHPHYGAEEKEFDLYFLHQLWVWIPATILIAIWWPIGIAAYILTYYILRQKARSKISYKSTLCGKELSASQVTD